MPKIGTVHWREFEKSLVSQGCEFKREKGDHRIYWKEGMNRPIVVPRDPQLPQMIVLNNLRTLGIDRDTYLKFLKRAER